MSLRVFFFSPFSPLSFFLLQKPAAIASGCRARCREGGSRKKKKAKVFVLPFPPPPTPPHQSEGEMSLSKGGKCLRTLLRRAEGGKKTAHARVRLHVRHGWWRGGWGKVERGEKTTSTLASFEQRNLARWRESCMYDRRRWRRASHQHVFLLSAFVQSFYRRVPVFFCPGDKLPSFLPLLTAHRLATTSPCCVCVSLISRTRRYFCPFFLFFSFFNSPSPPTPFFVASSRQVVVIRQVAAASWWRCYFVSHGG